MTDNALNAPIFCTISTAPYLAQAATLAASLRATHERSTLFVLLADRLAPEVFARRQQEYSHIGIQLIAREELACAPEVLERMEFYYTPFELCCALRGLLHEYIWRATPAAQWIFLDADIYAFAPFDELWKQLETATLLVTPHRRKPLDVAHAPHLERDILRGGTCNAGFVGVRRCEEAERFIAWLTARLERFALDDPFVRGWFVDQLWLNLALHTFENVQVAQHIGANVGHWNLFDARLEYSSETNSFQIDDRKLLFFHFSGWDPATPEAVSKHLQPAQELSPSQQPAWNALAARYGEALAAHHDATLPTECAFSRFADGRSITPWMRRHFYDLCTNGETPFAGSPFSQAEYFYQKQSELCYPPLWKRAARRLRKVAKSP